VSEWQEISLGNLVDTVVDNRGKTPPISKIGHELLEVNAISQSNRTPDYSKIRKFISEETYRNWFRKGHPQPGDILVPTVGTIGNVALVEEHRGTIAQNLIALRLKSEIDSRYVYYFLSSSLGKDLMLSLDIGGVQPSIKVPHLLDMAIPIPSYEEQKAIASVLSSLDDKIDLLHRQNKTLEAMAETLFRQWFVEEAEEDWEIGKLGNVISVKGGTTPSTKEPDYWNGNISWTSPRDLSNHDSVFLFETERKITEKGLSQIGSGLLSIGTVLLSSRAPIGYLAITEMPVAINQGYIAIVCDKIVSNYFIYLWCKANLEEIKNSGNGSVFQEISKSTFKEMTIILPPKKLLLEFDAKIFSAFKKIKINQLQIRTLESLRDSLLSKLMSGEVRVAV
jgi:type I restriction enzyme S subunit